MTIQPTQSPIGAPALHGDALGLSEAVGSADLLHEVARAAESGLVARVTDAVSLRQFLLEYRQRILAEVEWPAIASAFHHAQRYELRELVELDRRLATEPRLEPFARASQTVGRTYLRRLRPLRDQRLVRRYLREVEDGQAHGWHTLVFGVVLSVYSIPLRQGLVSYGRQTLAGFLESGVRRLGLGSASARSLGEELESGLPALAARLTGLADPSATGWPDAS